MAVTDVSFTMVETVIAYVAIAERAKDAIKTYSGGMKRRINLAASLIQNSKFLAHTSRAATEQVLDFKAIGKEFIHGIT